VPQPVDAAAFISLDTTHVMAVKKEFLDLIRNPDPHDPLRKDTEFRLYGRYRGDARTKMLLLCQSGDARRESVLVTVTRVVLLTVAQAVYWFPKDAALSRLDSTYPAHRLVHCIQLGRARTKNTAIVLLRPLNIFSMPQFNSRGLAQFCWRKDVGKQIRRGGVMQCLTPTGFRKQK
jgi:hypothetical protein